MSATAFFARNESDGRVFSVVGNPTEAVYQESKKEM